MRGLLFRTTSICLTGLLALAGAAACGGDDDDDDDTGDSPDAGDGGGDADAAVEPDAAPAVTRTGTIAVTDTTVTNPLAKVPIRGAVVTMTYVDDQSVVVAPLPDYPDSINGCAITVYDVTAGERPGNSVDEGAFTVTGTGNGEFRCAYEDGADDYVCQSTNADVRGGVVGNANTATLNVSGQFNLAGATFPPEMQGMAIQLSGFTGASGSADGTYPVIDVLAAPGTLLLASVPFSATGGTDATYTTFVGARPIPNPFGFEFLDDGVAKGAQDIVLTKDASEHVPGFTVTARARGEGFALTPDSTPPHEFPATADDVVFRCDAETGGCGSEPDQGPGLLSAMVINGVTTDVLPAENDDGTTMLPATGKFATFACSMIGADSITIPSDAVQAILDTDPARIQISVGRFAASLQTVQGQATSRIVMGHSLTGFTTFAPKVSSAR